MMKPIHEKHFPDDEYVEYWIVYFALFIIMISNMLIKLPCTLLHIIHLEVLLNQMYMF